MNPAMIAAWILGLVLVWQGGFMASGWLYAKLALVLALSGVHGILAKRLKEFSADANTRPARYYRVLNEAPTLLMIAIVVLVVVKPF
jgi:putative membrane protein